MQIRQLEALQAMAKTANSKVVFVPMSLLGDGGGNGGGGMFNGDASTSAVPAIINSMSEV
jgi:erythrocyte band 7 integral membrane protein